MQQLQEQPYMGTHMANKLILVVEDDDSIGTMLVDALSQETKYSTILVTDGLQALQIMHTYKPSLVITDYRLPYINGIELYDRVHANNDLADVPTILMSAYMPEEEIKKRQIISLHKPFELDELLETIELLIND
jgi:CheY-like chemotaxis protein